MLVVTEVWKFHTKELSVVCSNYVRYPSRNVRDRVDCNHLVHEHNQPSSDVPMGCLPVTCQVPTIANITLDTLATPYTLHTCYQSQEEIETQYGSDMVSFICN